MISVRRSPRVVARKTRRLWLPWLLEHGQSVVPMSSAVLELVTPNFSLNHPAIRLVRARILLADGRNQEAHSDASRALPHLTGTAKVECRTVVNMAAAGTPPSNSTRSHRAQNACDSSPKAVPGSLGQGSRGAQCRKWPTNRSGSPQTWPSLHSMP